MSAKAVSMINYNGNPIVLLDDGSVRMYVPRGDISPDDLFTGYWIELPHISRLMKPCEPKQKGE